MNEPKRVKRLELHTTQGDAGELLRESQFVVRYNDASLTAPERAISLTMPPRPEGWKSNQLPPVLAMNLPEGFLRDRVLARYRKVMDVDDDMNMLAVTSGPTAGRVWASVPDDSKVVDRKPVALREILSYPGTERLFDDLLDRYTTGSISGVQPKVVVPQASPRRGHVAKSAIKSPDLIVKSAGDQYPGLAENEFLCMSIARHVGLETPAFHLSDDRNLFVVERFDLGPHGYLGFEDLAALTGRHPSRKYEGAYSDIAKAISFNVAPAKRASSLRSLFIVMSVNCIVRNGDAHLKNFGVLYGDPQSAHRDARLAPVYDLICSTLYIRGDVLALGMGGEKSWPSRKVLERFGTQSCEVHNSAKVLDEVIERSMDFKPPDPASRVWRLLRGEMERSVLGLRATGK